MPSVLLRACEDKTSRNPLCLMSEWAIAAGIALPWAPNSPLAPVIFLVEDAVHDLRSASDRWHDHVAVDGFGDVGGPVAHCVADVLDRDAVVAHDRDGGVAALVGVPVTDACLVILEKRQLRASGVYIEPSS
jgi:hypothetical protein